MPDIPNVQFINLVDPPAQIDYDQFGNCRVPINPKATHNPLDVREYRRVTVMVGYCHAKSMTISMGKISGPTLCDMIKIPHDPWDNKSHTLEVIGPEMILSLNGGPANMSEKVQIFVYLKS